MKIFLDTLIMKPKTFALSLVLSSTILGLGMLKGIEYLSRKYPQINYVRQHKDAARYISMQDYVPIGNGGASLAAYGNISNERRKLEGKLKESYFFNMHAFAPQVTIDRANRLKDPNLTEDERLELMYGGSSLGPYMTLSFKPRSK